MIGPQTDNYQRLLKALIVNRRSQSRGRSLALHNRRKNSIPPIQESLYKGDRPDSRVLSLSTPCLGGLIRAKRIAADNGGGR